MYRPQEMMPASNRAGTPINGLTTTFFGTTLAKPALASDRELHTEHMSNNSLKFRLICHFLSLFCRKADELSSKIRLLDLPSDHF